MAELGAGATVAGLALAVPGIIDLIIKYGEWIRDRYETFKTPEPVWKELAVFGASLADGRLRSQLLLARAHWLREDCDPALKKSLEDAIDLLHDDVVKANRASEKYATHGFGARIGFALYGERKCKALNDALQGHQRELSDLLILKDIESRMIPNSFLLDQSRFRLNSRHGFVKVPYTSSLFIAKAEYKEDPNEAAIRNVMVLVERKDGNLAGISSYLQTRLSDNHSDRRTGVLRCLGYHLKPDQELIFELPDGADNPQTLQTIIASDQGHSHHPLDFRFRLCRQLAEAVLGVCSVGLVHKNIRTDTILIVQRQAQSNASHILDKIGFGDMFLTDWHLLRSHDGLTTGASSRDQEDWTKDMYRHPGRQGLQKLEERYNIGHDIYSLGVCLLEIGLWSVFVEGRTADGRPRVSGFFRAAAKLDSDPDPEAKLQSILRTPEAIRNVLILLAQQQLPSRMGLSFTRLVVSCLKGLDFPSGFGAEVKFREMNKTEQAVAFKNVVLSYFNDLFL
ncbi:hypothetical protein INS49_013247 [Diaporthe citri]|uniref:uncharacterized protein n=1 Tax=Diaporthe citri TaxID=83186 RepID=UPI001C7FD303|nr:uncharacterized protein INS49_013247 [Diaporthe citri]KAG6357370.1 hypothetical protein INS49_013247 [Diaporthe citri]